MYIWRDLFIIHFWFSIKKFVFEIHLILENQFKTYISSILSLKYNSTCYLTSEIYSLNKTNSKNIEILKDKILKEFKNPRNSSILHFIDSRVLVPMWALFNVFNFGEIRTFYKVLNESNRVKIAKCYKINPSDLDAYLSLINVIRNVCAHNSRLYNYINKSLCFRDFR